MNILFVCTGNTCRSPMAEHLLKKMLGGHRRDDVTVASSGIAPSDWPGLPAEAEALLRAEGITNIRHRPIGVDEKMISDADVILVMEAHHRDALLFRFPQAARKIHLLKRYAGVKTGREGIRDPFGGSKDDYAEAFADIKEALTGLLARLEEPDRRSPN